MKQIVEAQNKLSLEFPTDFIEYLKEFGLVNFYGVECRGLMGQIIFKCCKINLLRLVEPISDFPVNKLILKIQDLMDFNLS